jgi:hypothetical protein
MILPNPGDPELADEHPVKESRAATRKSPLRRDRRTMPTLWPWLDNQNSPAASVTAALQREVMGRTPTRSWHRQYLNSSGGRDSVKDPADNAKPVLGRPPVDGSDEQIEAWALDFVDQCSERQRNQPQKREK